MAFYPNPGDALAINGVSYRVAAHPASPAMPYGQEGREATVYMLDGPGGQRALKVLKPRFRRLPPDDLTGWLAGLAGIPGLEACRRAIVRPPADAALLTKHPDLHGAVLMPWVAGPSWMEVITERRALTPEQSAALARALAAILATLEERGAAHCDLSGANVLLPALVNGTAARAAGGSAAALVDVEQCFGPWLQQPPALPAGSPGYAHRLAREGLWDPQADRFAGAVLLAEMLGWCDERVRSGAAEESYFDPAEMHDTGSRAFTLQRVLSERWGAELARLFSAAWRSTAPWECPPLKEWMAVLPPAAERHNGEQPRRGDRRSDIPDDGAPAAAGVDHLERYPGYPDTGIPASRSLLRGADLSLPAPLRLRFEEAVLGAEREVELVRLLPCQSCGGAGSGVTGACATCRGAGLRRRPDRIVLLVPPGVEDGAALRWIAAGDEGVGGPPGDVLGAVAVSTHPHFTREGDDVVYHLTVNQQQAGSGMTVKVPTLEGDVSIAIPPFGRNQQEQRGRLPGRGVRRPDGTRGDQLVIVSTLVAGRVAEPPQPAGTTAAPPAVTPGGVVNAPSGVPTGGQQRSGRLLWLLVVVVFSIVPLMGLALSISESCAEASAAGLSASVSASGYGPPLPAAGPAR